MSSMIYRRAEQQLDERTVVFRRVSRDDDGSLFFVQLLPVLTRDWEAMGRPEAIAVTVGAVSEELADA